MDLDDLDRSIGDLTAALGDPTRRGIYLAIRESASPVTAPEIAARFNIHPNVARQVDLKFPTRSPNLLAELLIKIINELDGSHPVAEIAAAVGEDFGRELASRFAPEDAESKNEAMMAVAKAMGSIGFGSEAVGTTILTSHCPFGDVASSNPAIICSLDQGIVRGLFGVMNSKADPVLTPDAAHANCVTTTVDIQLSGTRS